MARPGLPRPAAAADPAYAGLKARIVARTGHHYYADKDDLLLDRLRRRLRATACADCAAYAALLADGARGEAEWQRLEAEVTVGETFFFRYAEQFQALRRTILPGLIAARAAERSLRIWSAGCSTGAEPYSLAILVREALEGALPEWRVAILGSDISAEALASARVAEYGRWALRTTPPEERLRYFTRLPASPGIRREGGYALRPEFRALVRFERQNLLAVAEPGPPQGEGYDLILCRNVLIYFDAETVAAVVRGLARRLRRGGWLLLGHAEPNPAFSGFLDPLSLPGTVAYRRREDAAALSVMPASDMVERTGPAAGAGSLSRSGERIQSHSALEPALRSPYPLCGGGWPSRERGPGEGSAGAGEVATHATACSVALPLSRPPDGGHPPPQRGEGEAPPGRDVSESASPGEGARRADPPADDAPADEPREKTRDRVRMLADTGETGAAWRALQAALDRHPTDPALRFYEGLLARTLGRDVEAERALRAALYLDRGFVMAHYHLGLLLMALGRAAEGARALDNAIALSQALPPDAALPEGDGAVAGAVAAGALAARAGLGPPAGGGV